MEKLEIMTAPRPDTSPWLPAHNVAARLGSFSAATQDLSAPGKPRCRGHELLSGENVVSADGQPHDVCFAGADFRPVGEEGTPVLGPGHLERARDTLYALDAQPCSELACLQVGDEMRHRPPKGAALAVIQAIEVAPEAISEVVGRH